MPQVKKEIVHQGRSLRTHPQKNNRFFGGESDYINTGHDHSKRIKLEQEASNHGPPVGDAFLQSLAEQRYRPQVNSIQGRFHDFEHQYVAIDRLAILQDGKNPYVWGAYAKQDVEGPRRIAEYFVERVKVPEAGSKEEERLSDAFFYNSFNDGAGRALMPVDGVVCWPEKVNSASGDETANVSMVRSGCHVYFEVPAGKKIKAGEQFLSYYGEEFFSRGEASFQTRVFINPCDNQEESVDKLKKYPYQRLKVRLDSRLLEKVALEASVQFAQPALYKLNQDTVNLPLLAYDDQQQVLAQHQQENLTLLHLACWMHDKKMLDALLVKGVYLRQLTKNFGFSALHFIVMSPHYLSALEKVQWITRLKQAGASMTLQDHDENTILHHAITTGQLTLLVDLIELDPKLLERLNLDDYDFFLQAIAVGSAEALSVLSRFITSTYLDAYLLDEDEDDEACADEEFSYLTAVLDDLYEDAPDNFSAVKDVLLPLCLEKNQALHVRLDEYYGALSQPQRIIS